MQIRLRPFFMVCVTASVVLAYVGRLLSGIPKVFWDGFCNAAFFGNAQVPAWGGHGRPEYNLGTLVGVIVVMLFLAVLVVATSTAFFRKSK